MVDVRAAEGLAKPAVAPNPDRPAQRAPDPRDRDDLPSPTPTCAALPDARPPTPDPASPASKAVPQLPHRAVPAQPVIRFFPDKMMGKPYAS